MNRISKIACFVIFSVLLTSGFPNFMMQEAHATVAYTGTQCEVNLDTDTVKLYYADSGASGASDIEAISDITYGDGSNTRTLADSSTDVATASQLTITITLGTADKYFLNKLGAITSCRADVDDDVSAVQNDLSTSTVTTSDDTSAPTISSATLDNSARTLTLTFNEGVSVPTVGGYTINGDSGSYTLTSGSVSGSEGSTSYTITYSTTDEAGINNISAGSDATVTVAASDVNNGQVNIAGATVSLTASNTSSGSNGSGCDGDCEEPTLGIDGKGNRVVDEGFTYNGHAVDVERFFTPYPQITVNVGKTNVAQFKIYENKGPDNIKHFTFAFGLDKGDIIADSKAKIELDRTWDGIETVTVFDPENVLDNIEVTTNTVSCSDDTNDLCLGISIQHRFRESLDFNIVATDVWDFDRQYWQNYYNHGIEVVGESLNNPNEHSGTNQGHIYHLMETGKGTAVDEFGDSWSFKYNKWSKDYIKQERISDGSEQVFDRTHSGFASYKNKQAEKAETQLLELCPSCLTEHEGLTDSFTYGIPPTDGSLEKVEILKTMDSEKEKAKSILAYLLNPASMYK